QPGAAATGSAAASGIVSRHAQRVATGRRTPAESGRMAAPRTRAGRTARCDARHPQRARLELRLLWLALAGGDLLFCPEEPASHRPRLVGDAAVLEPVSGATAGLPSSDSSAMSTEH